MLSVRRSQKMHWVFLLLLAAAVFCIIITPMVLMGYHYVVPYTIKSLHIFTQTGEITDTSIHMLLVMLSALSPVIAWNNVNAWVAVSVVSFCLSLLPLWWSVRMLFGEATAYLSVVIFATLPISWTIAVSMGGYCFAFLPLFLSFGSFIALHRRRPVAAVAVSGIFFGITMGTQHSYIAFLPWLAAMYLIVERRCLARALMRVGIFSGLAFAIFLLPMVPTALKGDHTPLDRIEIVLSPLKQATPGEGHLYPDEFLFEHYKDEYDAVLRKELEEESFLQRQENRNYHIIFGVERFSLLDRIGTGTWMLLNNIPQFFTLDFVGGAFIWLFILPGIVAAWKSHRTLVLGIAGLILVMEFMLRYILLFTSSHIDNYTWAIALFAGVGVHAVSHGLSTGWKLPARWKPVMTAMLCAVIAVQMLQANRKVLAYRYNRSPTPEIYAATEALERIDEDAVVASPRRHDLFTLSERKDVSIHPKTIEFLSERGKLAEPFATLGITHIIGYTREEERSIVRAAPSVHAIALPEDATPPISTLTRYLLYMLR